MFVGPRIPPNKSTVAKNSLSFITRPSASVLTFLSHDAKYDFLPPDYILAGVILNLG